MRDAMARMTIGIWSPELADKVLIPDNIFKNPADQAIFPVPTLRYAAIDTERNL
jgi:hypothetical protein